MLGVCEVRTVTLPGWCCVPGAGRSGRLTGFGIAQLVSTAWPIAILDCVSLGAGQAWPGYGLWQKPYVSNLLLGSIGVKVPDTEELLRFLQAKPTLGHVLNRLLRYVPTTVN